MHDAWALLVLLRRLWVLLLVLFAGCVQLASFYGRSMRIVKETQDLLVSRADAFVDLIRLLSRSVDCTPVYRGLQISHNVICRDATERFAVLGVVWLFTSLLAIALFAILFCVWRYLSDRYFKRREAEEAESRAILDAERAAEEARRAEREREAQREAAAAAAAAQAARAKARERQVSAAALNRMRTSIARGESASGLRWQIQGQSFGAAGAGGAREALAAHDQVDGVEDTMWADTALE